MRLLFSLKLLIKNCLPKLKPFDTGYLPECDGHLIFYQQFGNPKGEPVLSFHGGPGGCSKASHASNYNLKKYRVILFDQRGCGLSQSADPFYKNTIQATVKDALRLLEHLHITQKVTVAGASYGSTCALLFAEEHPEKVKRLILSCIFLARPCDIQNCSASAALFYPDAVDLFHAQAQKAGARSVEAYYSDLIFSNKLSDNKRALKYYGSFEHQLGHYSLKFEDAEQAPDTKAIQRFRIVMHYMTHKMFLSGNQLLRNADKISHIPTTIYQNRLDFCCPPYQAYELHKALPSSRLRLIADRGHGSEKLFAAMREDLK